MGNINWGKVGADDSRRRNAPLRNTRAAATFKMRATHPGICAGCAMTYRTLEVITPVDRDNNTVWVHWNRDGTNRCSHRAQGRTGML